MAVPTDPVGRRSVAWVYRGVWGVLTRWFLVPTEPPALPAAGGHEPIAMRPADGFLTYQRILFVVGWCVPIAVICVGVGALMLLRPVAGLFIGPPILIGLILIVGAAWVGIHVQFDTQWYVLTDRSVRIRRGVWVIEESTITFENVQDITVLQGPLQRLLGISDIVLEAAGGTSVHTGHSEHTTSNAGRLQGIANAVEVKEMIAARVRASRFAGLGDEHRDVVSTWGDAHTAMLREILAALQAATARR